MLLPVVDLLSEHLEQCLLSLPADSLAGVIHLRLELLGDLVVLLRDFNLAVALVELDGVLHDVEKSLLVQFCVEVETLRDRSVLHDFQLDV